MTVELQALVRSAIPLSEVLEHVATSISRFVRTPGMTPLEVEGASTPPSEIIIGPYPVDRSGPRPRPFSIWPAHYLCISSGRDTCVGLAVGHLLRDEEAGITVAQLSEAVRLQREERAGYRAMIDIGFGRTRTSFALGAFLAYSIATLNRSRILDDEGHFKQGELLDPQTVAARFANHRDARSFADFSELFCDELGVRFGE
ncbi:MAG TPA: hypothetical protein VIX73_25590 [Kofleriaceae bacterium]|jgi:hypothetical protein